MLLTQSKWFPYCQLLPSVITIKNHLFRQKEKTLELNNMENKIKKIIEILDVHIRGAGDYEGVKMRTQSFLDKFLNKNIQDGWSILDIGAGDCLTCELIKKSVRWVGINKGIDWEINKDKYPIINTDFHNLDFDSNSFDLVISVNTLEHAYFPMLMLFEINRVSKNLIYIQIPVPSHISGLPYDNHPDHYFVCSDLSWENIFNKLGFEILEKAIAGGEYQYLLRKTKDWY